MQPCLDKQRKSHDFIQYPVERALRLPPVFRELCTVSDSSY